MRGEASTETTMLGRGDQAENRSVASVLAIVLTVLIWGCRGDEPVNLVCPDQWRLIDDDVVFGEATTSIRYQRKPDENPYPPDEVLENRALEAARIMAMQKAVESHGCSIDSAEALEGGRLGSMTTRTCSGVVFRVVTCHSISGDTVHVQLRAQTNAPR